ncbi:VgrG-related protein [Lentimicrobium sp.]
MPNESTIPTSATPDVITITILVAGTKLPGAFPVLAVSVSRELNRIPTATIHFKDGDAAKGKFEISDSAFLIPGMEIEIQLGYRSQNKTVFKGIITHHSISVRRNNSMLIVECRDKAVKMTSGKKSKYFTDQKDSDIMEAVIGQYGLSKEVEATNPDLKQVVQYDATDWDFLLLRAEANGQVVMVEDGKVRIAKPATGSEAVVSVEYGNTLIELDAMIDARLQSEGIKTGSWLAADQEIINAEAREPNSTRNGNISTTDLSAVIGGGTHEKFHGGALSQPELQAWADGLLLKERLAKTRGRVKFQGFADAMPGKLIEINGIGERFQGKMYISGVRHSVSGGNWETDVQLGLSPELFAETYNLRTIPASGLIPGISGLQIGVVTVLEGDPAGNDRIKIRLPIISMADEGIWARISTLDAGKNRGTFFRPEIGDEVIVGFLNDDPRNPIVLGMCHSAAKPAPEPPKDDNHLKGYVSRENMRFIFDDDNKVILIETPAGNKITISEENSGIVMEDQNGNKITMDNTGIAIESIKDLTLKAAQDIKIEGINATFSASGSFTAKGSGSVEVKGASISINGSATTEIKGGMVMIN